MGELGEHKEKSYEMIMPVEEVAYAACSRPTQNDHPAGQPD